MTTTVGTGTNYPVPIPDLSDTADIQEALKFLVYGKSILSTDTDSEITSNSIAGALKLKAPLISPSFTTPSLGVATATSINGTIIPTSKTLVYESTSGNISQNALTATTATHIAGGAQYNLLVQSGSGATSFVTNASSNGYLLQYTSSGPTWVDYSTNGTIANATNAEKVAIANETTNATRYITFADANTGNNNLKVTSTKLTFNPSTGNISSTTFNALTLTAVTTGFTVAGGTTSKTLTISGDATISGGTHSGTNTGDQTTITGNAGSATKLFTARAINGQDFDGTQPITIKASTTYALGLTTNGNLAFSSGTTWDGGTTGITIGLSATPANLTSINSFTIPTYASGASIVTTNSTTAIAASTTGSAAKSVYYVANNATYPTTPVNRIFVGQTAPTTPTPTAGDIWMW